MDHDNLNPEEQPIGWLDDDAMQLIQVTDDLEVARATIADLLTETEDVLTRKIPRIEAEWQLVIGVWENRLLEAQIAMRRARRRCNLVQARVNTGEPVDMQEVEMQLDVELQQWQDQLEVAVERYQSAVSAQKEAIQITAADARKQKSLFRMLAKRLHPDLHPGQDDSARAMFTLAELAYRRGDMNMLESLEISTRNLDTAYSNPSSLIEAQAELVVLQAQVQSLREQLDQIKREAPYCLRAKLDDSAWVDAHIAQLKQEIADCNEAERDYQARCEGIAGTHG